MPRWRGMTPNLGCFLSGGQAGWTQAAQVKGRRSSRPTNTAKDWQHSGRAATLCWGNRSGMSLPVTSNKDLKNRVRARMKHTGENYTQAQAAIQAIEPAFLPDLSSLSPEDRRHFVKVAKGCFRGKKLIALPEKRKSRVVVLLMLLARFEPARTYTEREVNELLSSADGDYAFLRRELVNYGYLQRAHGNYWMSPEDPVHGTNVQQEVPSSERAYLQALRQPRPND